MACGAAYFWFAIFYAITDDPEFYVLFKVFASVFYIPLIFAILLYFVDIIRTTT
jgi:hypothetical protein